MIVDARSTQSLKPLAISELRFAALLPVCNGFFGTRPQKHARQALCSDRPIDLSSLCWPLRHRTTAISKKAINQALAIVLTRVNKC
eukprot:271124-Amphidinium_carterae.1